ncbi:ABC transporter substrate-binding protein [Marinobacter nanhaiticus D15-8W]|nr:ABC transporter substrate-binding protein [Marinobacter nanhaiticus D15-8W]
MPEKTPLNRITAAIRSANISLLLFLFLQPLKADTITLVADYWCPFNCEPSSESPGYLVEVAEKALGKAGHRVIYVTLPWSRAINDVRNGKYGGLLGAGTQEVPDFVFPQRPLAMARHTFFTLPQSTWTYDTDASLGSIKLGVIDDYSYGDLNIRYILPNRSDRKRLLILNGQNVLGRFLDMLEINRIDAFVEEEAVMAYFLQSQQPVRALRKAGVAYREPIYIAFSPALTNARQYAKDLNDGLRLLRDSGELMALAEKYGITLRKPSPIR